MEGGVQVVNRDPYRDPSAGGRPITRAAVLP
jgi:hypothetical protein